MMKKLTAVSLFIFFCVVTAILTAGLVFYQNKNNANIPSANENLSGNLPPSTILNSAEVSKHNTSDNCWIIVNSKVYNISGYASSHPGGSRNITNYCGKESTNAFDTKGGNSGAHSPNANNLLDKYFVGNLNQSVDQATVQQNTKANPVPISTNNEYDD